MTEKAEVLDEIILPRGFRATGVHAGIKKSGAKDMALIVSDVPAVMAGTFTTNKVKAATVKLCMERLKRRKGRAVVINSGNANAATGAQGLKNADAMSAETARLLGLDKKDVFVCSTGTIGVQLNMEKITSGIQLLASALTTDGGTAASDGIMTTDRWPKRVTAKLSIGGKPVTISAMAKGAGMIEPNMATMLCFIMTDAAVEPKALQACLSATVKETFNRISVDGDMSTNDTVLCFANGAAGNKPLTQNSKDWKLFFKTFQSLELKLAMSMVRDGEGATKVATIRVKGAASEKDAEAVARAVANSMLVKTSWAGTGCNWGRVMDAIGYAPAKVVESKIKIDYDGTPAVRKGIAAGTPRETLNAIVQKEYFTIDIDLGLGRGSSHVYACDTGHEYIDINV